MMGMLVDEKYGGSATGPVSFALALSEISAGCASTSVTMGVTNMIAEIVHRFGNQEQREKYLPPFLRGESGVGAFALTEPGAGSDARSISTFARKEGNAYRLNGSKVFITNGEYAGLVVVIALTGKDPRELTAFIVEPGFKGFTIGKREKKMGLKGSNTVELVFDDMAVPRENVLGKEGEGFKIAMAALDGGRIGIGSQCVGIASAALECAVAYAKERSQFGTSISDFQAIQWMLADAGTEIEAARLLTLRAAHLKERGVRFSREASMAKLFSSEMAYRVCHKAVQILGGYGYISEYPVERFLRDVKVTTIYEGTSEVQRLVISRSILRD
ncbi:MAG: acyl-CoA dehydrogenase [Deltaproteobacteria bacterium]|nr:acyl-CoA dehydrogenase [Deltaproteobacteria bacterium]NIS76944.1 acyl-CoA dehydrogenase [Deltaproteobacteria bacterium]